MIVLRLLGTAIPGLTESGMPSSKGEGSQNEIVVYAAPEKSDRPSRPTA